MNWLIIEKKMARGSKGQCINCGSEEIPCNCKVPKRISKFMPVGISRMAGRQTHKQRIEEIKRKIWKGKNKKCLLFN